MASVIRIKPLHYIHVLDNNKNVTRVEIGPQTFTRQDHEKVVEGPSPMIIIPPRKYAIIDNPVDRDDSGIIIQDKNGNALLRHGDQEIREHCPPFPLYPGERLNGRVSPLQVVAANTALRLKCLRDFEEIVGDKVVERRAGEEWLWVGPGTYIPKVQVQVLEIIRSTLVRPLEALRIRALREFVSKDGVRRDAGEEWLHKTTGGYLPDVNEQIVATVRAVILSDTKALSLRATRTFTDVFGKERKAGSEWLVTNEDAVYHIPDVFEEVVGEVRITSLNNRQYCVVLDPVDSKGVPQLGKKELRRGPSSFFLLPGERLESGIQNIKVLGEDEALLLSAKEAFFDEDFDGLERHPGDRWMIYGPRDYVTPVEVEVLETRKSIPLDDNEGIYVRDVTTGKVSSVVGKTYMLKPNEELWEKKLPSKIEELLANRYGNGDSTVRDSTRVVTLRAPRNTAVQIYDYKEKKARVVFGPDLIMLGPDEHFTLLSLSGDKPKRPHVIKDLCLLLGPEFSTDVVTVETADHARLSLKLSYNWHFEVDKTSSEDSSKIFVVPDFVGDFCKAIASRVRGAVAQSSFDSFHKNSARIIRAAVFGLNESGKIKNKFVFTANNLVITNIDIQSVEPVDQRTRDSLQKSVQLAIEITTKSQEASARHAAEREEQQARGRLERQKITDEAEAEKARKDLLTLQAQSAAVETTGQATAEAKAKAASAKIEGEASVKQSELKAQSLQIKSAVELETKTLAQEVEIEHTKALDSLELRKAKELAEIEANKFKSIVRSIGADTIESIAQAGPEMQAKLLEGLGLKSFLITDGNSPINLFNTAEGLISASPSLD